MKIFAPHFQAANVASRRPAQAAPSQQVQFGYRVNDVVNHEQELTQFLDDLEQNLNKMQVLDPTQYTDSPNKEIRATLKHPSGRHLGVTLYSDYKDNKRLACFEVSGSADIQDSLPVTQPNRNPYLEKLRYNNWTPGNNSYIEYQSTYCPSHIRIPESEILRDTALLAKVDAFGEKLKAKLLAANPQPHKDTSVG